MSEVVIERAEGLVHAADTSCDDAALLQATARALRIDSLILKVRAQEVRGARRIHGGSSLAQERDADGDVQCPVCDKGVRPGESSGDVDGKVAHLACWIKNARHAPPRPKS